jgi:hypothetical protein
LAASSWYDKCACTGLLLEQLLAEPTAGEVGAGMTGVEAIMSESDVAVMLSASQKDREFSSVQVSLGSGVFTSSLSHHHLPTKRVGSQRLKHIN